MGNKITIPEQTIVDKKYIVDGYDIVRSVHLEEYNAGYKAEERGARLQARYLMIRIMMVLSMKVMVFFPMLRFHLPSDLYFTDGKWIEDEEYEGYSVLTDENGKYSFDDLDTYISIDGTNHLYGYEVWVTNAPDDYAITRYRMTAMFVWAVDYQTGCRAFPKCLTARLLLPVQQKIRQVLIQAILLKAITRFFPLLLKNIMQVILRRQKGTITGVVFDDKTA